MRRSKQEASEHSFLLPFAWWDQVTTNCIRSPRQQSALLTASHLKEWNSAGAMWGRGLKYILTCLFFCFLAWQTVRYERINSQVNAATWVRVRAAVTVSPLLSLTTGMVAPPTNSCVGPAALICCSGCALRHPQDLLTLWKSTSSLHFSCFMHIVTTKQGTRWPMGPQWHPVLYYRTWKIYTVFTGEMSQKPHT